jgi:hypothetical protein
LAVTGLFTGADAIGNQLKIQAMEGDRAAAISQVDMAKSDISKIQAELASYNSPTSKGGLAMKAIYKASLEQKLQLIDKQSEEYNIKLMQIVDGYNKHPSVIRYSKSKEPGAEFAFISSTEQNVSERRNFPSSIIGLRQEAGTALSWHRKTEPDRSNYVHLKEEIAAVDSINLMNLDNTVTSFIRESLANKSELFASTSTEDMSDIRRYLEVLKKFNTSQTLIAAQDKLSIVEDVNRVAIPLREEDRDKSTGNAVGSVILAGGLAALLKGKQNNKNLLPAQEPQSLLPPIQESDRQPDDKRLNQH